MRLCHIHCGPHKTGSSSLQRSLQVNRLYLAARGFVVPAVSDTRFAVDSHLLLAGELPQLAAGPTGRLTDRPPAWTRLARQLQGGSAVPLLSSEIFSLHFLKEATVNAVTGFLHMLGYRAHFIYYIRDNPAWLNSLYVQETKRFYTALAFEPYIEAAFGRARFDYGALLRHVSGNPAAMLTAIPFEPATRSGLLDAFLAAVTAAEGLPPLAGLSGLAGLAGLIGLIEAARANPNAGVKAVHVGRTVADLLAARGLNPRAHRDLYGQFKQTYRARRWTDDPYCGLNDALAARIVARYQPRNDRLAQALWGNPWSEVIAPAPGFRENHLGIATDPPRDLRDMDATLQHLRAMIDAIP